MIDSSKVNPVKIGFPKIKEFSWGNSSGSGDNWYYHRKIICDGNCGMDKLPEFILAYYAFYTFSISAVDHKDEISTGIDFLCSADNLNGEPRSAGQIMMGNYRAYSMGMKTLSEDGDAKLTSTGTFNSQRYDIINGDLTIDLNTNILNKNPGNYNYCYTTIIAFYI